MQKPNYYHHSNVPSPVNKPKPTIEKITFTEQEAQEIKSILESKGNKYTKGRTPASPEYLKKKVKAKYYKGICGLCSDFPEYRVLYNMDGAILKENYCTQNFKQYFPDELI
jgi:hypothetical protein